MRLLLGTLEGLLLSFVNLLGNWVMQDELCLETLAFLDDFRIGD